MSEKIYAWLLRLYPSHFRKTYGEASLLLFRDRCRDERGFFQKARLCLDLLFDLFLSLPREHRRARGALEVTSGQYGLNRVPSFYVLEDEQPQPGALLCAAVLTLATVSVIWVLASHGGDQRRRQDASAQSLAPKEEMTSAQGEPDAESSRNTSDESKVSEKLASAATNALDRGIVNKTGSAAEQAYAQSPNPQDATRAMIALFRTHNLVMLGEMHGNEQEYEWLSNLVQTPEFDDGVDDIVVEFGNSRYQDTVDRYVAGQDVRTEQVQKAWRDMVLSVVPVQPVYAQFYEAVREANLKRRGKHQLRIVLGSPPADWDKIRDHKDLEPYMNERDEWYAQVVKKEVMARRHRALLIMGAGHLLREDGPGVVEHELRAAGADPYLVVFGTNAVDSRGDVDKRFDSWPMPAIVPLAGNWVGQLPAQPVVSGGRASATSKTLADEADAMLYVAPCRSLRDVYVPRSELEGTPYGKEIARRNLIILGSPVNFLFDDTEPVCAEPKPSAQ